MAILFLPWGDNDRDSDEYEQGVDIIRNLVKENLPSALPEPLADEVENLTRDSESAVRFLVACVTVDPTETRNESIN